MNAGPLTLGTAGHIDHGKTALIGALTGVDTDRLPEERERGISIELGYASLELPSGRTLSVVDVPGHERFVRTMVSGATGIDLFLMTIAADDGVMPQTREHAAVLRALGVEAGIIAVTKVDLADPEMAILEAGELLPGVETIAVSARTGIGLDVLRQRLDVAAGAVASRAERDGPARLHIDRVFTIRGAGTVVTGTLWAGSIARGDELVVLPSGREVRVRGVQVHDEAAERAAAGQRVAVNLVGVATSEIARGDVLGTRNAGLRPTYLLDGELAFAATEPEHGDRVQVHHGTRESPGPARLARRSVLAGPARTAARPGTGRPVRRPSDRAPGHARRRDRPRSGASQARTEPTAARGPSPTGPRRGTGGAGCDGPAGGAHGAPR